MFLDDMIIMVFSLKYLLALIPGHVRFKTRSPGQTDRRGVPSRLAADSGEVKVRIARKEFIGISWKLMNLALDVCLQKILDGVEKNVHADKQSVVIMNLLLN